MNDGRATGLLLVPGVVEKPLTLPTERAPARPPPLALYVHIPWCLRKCPYCDFNSHALRGEMPEAAYLEALTADLEQALPEIWGRPVDSVFFGGGTPSLLSAKGLDQLLTTLRTLLPIRPHAEITLEANPGTFEMARFRDYRQAGINRLSLGIQSFSPRHLVALGRVHDEREARTAAESARGIFDRLNLDLMYALPGQTLEELAVDLDTALSFGPDHMSCYHLTVEPNTAFAEAPPPLPDEDLAAEMQNAVELRLQAAGFRHYETSAYARSGAECRHNLNYWLFGDYLGIGAGAHSKLTFHDRVVRQARPKSPRDYLAGAVKGRGFSDYRNLDSEDLAFEFMMNALRLSAGFESGLFTERTGLPISSIRPRLDLAVERGFLEYDGLRIQPTELGRRFLNDALQIFLA